MSDQSSDFGAFIAGMVIGGLVGAAVALLLAPQSGEETQKMIKEKSIELKDKAVLTAEEARARAEKALEEARIKADQAMADVRARSEELASLTRQRAAELQQRGQVVIEEQRARLGRKKAAPSTDSGETPSEPGEAPA
jgi:gas vesicle protein